MKPERWEQVAQLHRAALECEGSERSAFLREACGGDEDLRREVESLLAYEGKEASFMESPALEVAAKQLARREAEARARQSSEDISSLVGKTVSHYRIVEKLGSGGMGVVYKAQDTKLPRFVALKFLPEVLAESAEALERFKREARAASALNHPNICTVHDIDEHEGRVFIVMELLEGHTLGHRISGKPLPTELVLELGNQIAGALAAAHAKGITHRDVKPANIFVTEQEQAKLLDFGLAMIAMRAEAATGTEARHDLPSAPSGTPFGEDLTRTGMLMGTVPYMSPEQVRGEPLDAQTDLFSFGTVLYEMTTGLPAFSGETIGQIFDAILSHEPIAPRLLNARVPAALQRVITKALSKKRQERYRNASELGADFKAVRLEMERRRVRWRNRALAAALGVLLVLVGISWRLGRLRPGVPAAGQIQSIAVLPLENLSGDPAQEYFADGMTDALITDLGKITGLGVISRTSAMLYKGAKKPLPEIGRELGVDAVVEGTVQRSGGRVRVTAQLLDARTDRHLWAESYERDSEDVIRLEKQIALGIAHEVSGRLTTDEETRLASKRTVNPQAYDAYLHGRHLWNERTAETAVGARVYFEQALREDPGFALAYSGLADYYTVGWGPWMDQPLAEKYARKAVALEPDLAEAHASLGIACVYQRKFAEGDKELKRAIELNPNYVMAHYWSSLYLLTLGRLTEAVAENDRARQLDPFSLPVNYLRGVMLLGLHEYDRAVEQLETAAAINPQSALPHGQLARIYWIEGRVPDALAEERKAAALAHDPALFHDQEEIAAAYAKSGLRAAQLKAAQLKERGYEADRQEQESGALFHESYSALFVAFQYGLLKDRERVLHWLNQACHERPDLITNEKSAPELDFLRSDPRFQDLLRRMNFPP